MVKNRYWSLGAKLPFSGENCFFSGEITFSITTFLPCRAPLTAMVVKVRWGNKEFNH